MPVTTDATAATPTRCHATRKHCAVGASGKALLESALERMGLSARAYDKILRVARTLADLEDKPDIQDHHLAEAIQYRSLDREMF